MFGLSVLIVQRKNFVYEKFWFFQQRKKNDLQIKMFGLWDIANYAKSVAQKY